MLGGRFVLRICIVNFRTEAEDVEALLDVAAELGATIDARAAAGGVAMTAKAFALLGSGEFDPWTESVDRRLVSRPDAPGSRVLILPTASAAEGDDVFDMWANKGKDHYDALGIDSQILPLKTREDAARPEFVAALDDAATAFFSGGNPAYLAATLLDTPFWEALRGAARARDQRTPAAARASRASATWRPTAGAGRWTNRRGSRACACSPASCSGRTGTRWTGSRPASPTSSSPRCPRAPRWWRWTRTPRWWATARPGTWRVWAARTSCMRRLDSPRVGLALRPLDAAVGARKLQPGARRYISQ